MSSFNYTADIVDIEGMNINDMFPEQSSFSFDMSSSYNHSYTDSISGIPLHQQALWDDGQLSLPPTVNSSRVLRSTVSSLNNSANTSLNHDHSIHPLPTSSLSTSHAQRFLAPPSHHHHRGHPLQVQFQGSPLRGDGKLFDDDDDQDNHDNQNQIPDGNQSKRYGDLASFRSDAFDPSNGSVMWPGWEDDDNFKGNLSRESRGSPGHMTMVYPNDPAQRDEQHQRFLQDIGSSFHGDSISLFAKLDEESDLSYDLFKEELIANDTGDISRFGDGSFDQGQGGYKAPLRISTHNDILNQELIDSLRTPIYTQPPPPLQSSNFKRENILDGLHAVPAPSLSENSCQPGSHSDYELALKGFKDSLKIADPIKTPHKFAPQPLPILWNTPRIRSKALPTFNLSDYRTGSTVPRRLSTSVYPSPSNSQSTANSAHSSPPSSLSASPPTAISKMNLYQPKSPTTPTYHQFDKDIGAYQRKPSIEPSSDLNIPKPERVSTTLADLRAKRAAVTNVKSNEPPPTFQEPITPDDAQTLRQSQFQQPIGSPNSEEEETSPSGHRPVVRKRRSLHQDMFQDLQNEKEQLQDINTDQYQDFEQALGRHASRPVSMNILPESLTSVNNHAMHEEATQRAERARRLSEEEEEAKQQRLQQQQQQQQQLQQQEQQLQQQQQQQQEQRISSIGRAGGSRYNRDSGSGDLSPTIQGSGLPPPGNWNSRVRRPSQRLSITGTSVFSKPQGRDSMLTSPTAVSHDYDQYSDEEQFQRQISPSMNRQQHYQYQQYDDHGYQDEEPYYDDEPLPTRRQDLPERRLSMQPPTSYGRRNHAQQEYDDYDDQYSPREPSPPHEYYSAKSSPTEYEPSPSAIRRPLASLTSVSRRSSSSATVVPRSGSSIGSGLMGSQLHGRSSSSGSSGALTGPTRTSMYARDENISLGGTGLVTPRRSMTSLPTIATGAGATLPRRTPIGSTPAGLLASRRSNSGSDLEYARVIVPPALRPKRDSAGSTGSIGYRDSMYSPVAPTRKSSLNAMVNGGTTTRASIGLGLSGGNLAGSVGAGSGGLSRSSSLAQKSRSQGQLPSMGGAGTRGSVQPLDNSALKKRYSTSTSTMTNPQDQPRMATLGASALGRSIGAGGTGSLGRVSGHAQRASLSQLSSGGDQDYYDDLGNGYDDARYTARATARNPANTATAGVTGLRRSMTTAGSGASTTTASKLSLRSGTGSSSLSAATGAALKRSTVMDMGSGNNYSQQPSYGSSSIGTAGGTRYSYSTDAAYGGDLPSGSRLPGSGSRSTMVSQASIPRMASSSGLKTSGGSTGVMGANRRRISGSDGLQYPVTGQYAYQQPAATGYGYGRR
ncbi:hypothetical protein BGZ82_011196 [Podila clonocystis]|nr:hypothetical protein BGZ82_011196 [Podila clonocystis]